MKKQILLALSSLFLLAGCGTTGDKSNGGVNNNTEQQDEINVTEKGIQSLDKVLNYFYNSSNNTKSTSKRNVTKGISSDSDIYKPEYKLDQYTDAGISNMSVPLSMMKLFSEVMKNSNYVYSEKPTRLTFGMPEGEGNLAVTSIKYEGTVFTCDLKYEDISMYMKVAVSLDSDGTLSYFDVYGKSIGGSSDGYSLSEFMHFESANLYVYHIYEKDGNVKLDGDPSEEKNQVAKYCYDKMSKAETEYIAFYNEKGIETNNHVFKEEMDKAMAWQNEYIGYASEGNLPESDCTDVTEEDFNKSIQMLKGENYSYVVRYEDKTQYSGQRELRVYRQGNIVKTTISEERVLDPIEGGIKDGQPEFNKDAMVDLIYVDTYYSLEDDVVYKYTSIQLDPQSVESIIWTKSQSEYTSLSQINPFDLSSYKFSDFTKEGAHYKTDKSVSLLNQSYDGFSLFFINGKLTEFVPGFNTGESSVVVFAYEEFSLELPQTTDEGVLISEEQFNSIINLYKSSAALDMYKANDPDNVIRVYPNLSVIRVKGNMFVEDDIDHAYAVEDINSSSVLVYNMDEDDNIISKQYLPLGYTLNYFYGQFDSLYYDLPKACLETSYEALRFDKERNCYNDATHDFYFENNNLVKIVNPDNNMEFSNFVVGDEVPSFVKYEEEQPYTEQDFAEFFSYPANEQLSITVSAEDNFITIDCDGVSLAKYESFNGVYTVTTYTVEDKVLYKYEEVETGSGLYKKVLETTYDELADLYKIIDFSIFDYNKCEYSSGVGYVTAKGTYSIYGFECNYFKLDLSRANDGYINMDGYNSKDEQVMSIMIDKHCPTINLPELAEEPFTDDEFDAFFALENNISVNVNSINGGNVETYGIKICGDKMSINHIADTFYYELVDNQVYEANDYGNGKELAPLEGKTSFKDVFVDYFDFSSINHENSSYSYSIGSYVTSASVSILGTTFSEPFLLISYENGSLMSLYIETSNYSSITVEPLDSNSFFWPW